MALNLILANDSEIIISDATYTKHYVINCENLEEWQTKRNLMTSENLSDIKLYEDGTEVAHIKNLILSGSQEVINEDGSITGHFYFRGGQNLTNEYSEAGRILMGDEETMSNLTAKARQLRTVIENLSSNLNDEEAINQQQRMLI